MEVLGADHRPPPDGSRQLVVGGLRTRVRVRGEGPPLLLIMGMWGEIRAWDTVIDHLGGFRTIAFDAPGIGSTDLPSIPQSLPALARFTAGVLDAVGVARAHVLGVSFGGIVAQQLAGLCPERVDRLVLASTTSNVLCLPGHPSALFQILDPWSLASAGRLADPGSVFGGRIRTQPELVARLGLRPPASLAAYLHRLSGLTGWWGLPWAIRHRTLVLTGDDDPVVPAGNSRILAACLPDARLHVVRGGGHLVLFDSAAEVAPVIAGFLAEPGRDLPRPTPGTLVA